MYRRMRQPPSEPGTTVSPQQYPPQQIFAIANIACDDDAKVSAQHHQAQQQVPAITSSAGDDKVTDTENEKNDVVLWPTSDAAKFQPIDKQHLLENSDC